MTLDESWFYLLTSHEIVWVQASQPSPEKWNTWLETTKWWSQSFGIHNVSILSTCFQKIRNLMPAVISIWSCNHFSRIAQLDLAQVSSFMRTMHGLTSLERLSNFAGKNTWE
jgi:hypothetical protein